MKAILQRTTHSLVKIENEITGEIEQGIMLLLGIMDGDTKPIADALVSKIAGLRIFSDDNGKMNLSLQDVDGEILVVPNFTLGADCRKGRRPSFAGYAKADVAEPLYEYVVAKFKDLGIKKVAAGKFGADMELSIINNGPVTIIIDTDELFIK